MEKRRNNRRGTEYVSLLLRTSLRVLSASAVNRFQHTHVLTGEIIFGFDWLELPFD